MRSDQNRAVNPEVAGSSPVEPAIKSSVSVTVFSDCHRNAPEIVTECRFILARPCFLSSLVRGARPWEDWLSTGPTPEQRQRFEATTRILQGEDPEDVARDLGLAPSAVRRAADDLIGPEDLKPVLERMAVDHGLVGRTEFPFSLGVGSKFYQPDCVWFGGRAEPKAVARRLRDRG
jgi:hypothetical protein